MHLDSKQTISVFVFCFPPSPSPATSPRLPWDAHFPLCPSSLCPIRWQGQCVERLGRCRNRSPGQWCLSSPSLCPYAPSYPWLQPRPWPCALVCTCTHGGEGGHVSGPAPDTALGCQPPLPALLHHHNLTPHSCSLKQKQPLAFPPPLCSIWLTTLQGLLGSLSCVRFVSGVPSVNSLHPSRPLPGALSALPSTVGGPQHSSVGFTGKVAPAVDFQSLSQTAQGFL